MPARHTYVAMQWGHDVNAAMIVFFMGAMLQG